jgi:hypothetical protein
MARISSERSEGHQLDMCPIKNNNNLLFYFKKQIKNKIIKNLLLILKKVRVAGHPLLAIGGGRPPHIETWGVAMGWLGVAEPPPMALGGGSAAPKAKYKIYHLSVSMFGFLSLYPFYTENTNGMSILPLTPKLKLRCFGNSVVLELGKKLAFSIRNEQNERKPKYNTPK